MHQKDHHVKHMVRRCALDKKVKGPLFFEVQVKTSTFVAEVNVLANIISPINDFMNLAPQHFSYRGCGYVVLILSLLVCPWWTFSGKVSFVLNFLTGHLGVDEWKTA